MSPVVLSAALFLILEGLHHFNAVLSFGVAIGMLITGLLILWTGALDAPKAPKEARLDP